MTSFVPSRGFLSIFCDLCAPRSMCFYAVSNPTQGWRTLTMKHKSASIQPDLFEQNEPRVFPVPSQKEQLTTLVEALLLEIAAVLATGGAAADHDHPRPPGPRRFRLPPPINRRAD